MWHNGVEARLEGVRSEEWEVMKQLHGVDTSLKRRLVVERRGVGWKLEKGRNVPSRYEKLQQPSMASAGVLALFFFSVSPFPGEQKSEYQEELTSLGQ